MATGFEEFADEFRDLADDVDEVSDRVYDDMRAGVEQTAKDLRFGMRKRAPKGESGKLRESITFDVKRETADSISYSVGPDHAVCDYAQYVEYGTGSEGETQTEDTEHQASGDSYYITPDGLDPMMAKAALDSGDPDRVRILAEQYDALAWDGADHPVILVEHPGVKSQAFFRPTMAEAVADDWLVDNINDELDETFIAFNR